MHVFPLTIKTYWRSFLRFRITLITSQVFSENEEKLRKTETRMKKVEEQMSKGIQQVDFQSPSFRDILQKSVSEKIGPKLDKLENQEEKQLIEQKKNNMVLFNVPESLSKDKVARMTHDRKMFLTIYDVNEEEFDDKCINVIHRIGNSEAQKPRPMIIKFAKQETKDKYLQLSGDLALTVDEEEESTRLQTGPQLKGRK